MGILGNGNGKGNGIGQNSMSFGQDTPASGQNTLLFGQGGATNAPDITHTGGVSHSIPTQTYAAAESVPGEGAGKPYANMNPLHQLMAMKTGIVSNKSTSYQPEQQSEGGYGAFTATLTASKSQLGQGGMSYEAQRESGAGTQAGVGAPAQKPSSRPLTDLEKYYLRGAGFDDELLDNMTLHFGKPGFHSFAGKDGSTHDAQNIYIKHGVYDHNNINDLEFLAHELHHANQYRNGMTWDGYARDYKKYEKEANEQAAQTFERIKALRKQEIQREEEEKYGPIGN